MTENNGQDTYIVCSNCKCKYINDEEHINKDFGYTRLEMRYKTCVKCRANGKVRNKRYCEKHPKKTKSIMMLIKKKRTNIINNTERTMLIG